MEHIIYESAIDNRQMICTCGNKECKIGLNFDETDDGIFVMLLTDRYGNENPMFLDQAARNRLSRILRDFKPFDY